MRRSKTLSLSAVLFSAVVAAGCASHPERPATPPVHAEAKATTPPAHLFDGCEIIGASPAGYYLRCGSALAAVATQPGIDPDSGVAVAVAAFVKPFPKGSVTTSKEQITIAGRTYDATRAVATLKVKDRTGTFTQRFVGLKNADGGTTVVECGGVLPEDEARCPGLFAWLVDHPTTPPPIADKSGATSWPPKEQVVIPAGCQRDESSPGALSLSCPNDVITIVRLAETPAGQEGYARGADKAVEKAVESAKKNGATSIHAAKHDCKVGGKPGACRRIAVDTPQGKGVLVLGVGELYDSTTLVMCFSPDTGAPPPADCATFLTLGAPLVEPAAAPAAGGSSATP